MQNDSPSNSEIASLFGPLVKPDINAELKLFTQSHQTDELIRPKFRQVIFVVGNITWSALQNTDIERSFRVVLDLDPKYKQRQDGYGTGLVRLKDWTPNQLIMEHFEGQLSLWVTCNFSFEIKGYYQDKTGQSDLFNDTLTRTSSIRYNAGFIPLPLFRLWTQDRLFDPSIGVPKPNTNGSLFDYGEGAIYPTEFIRLIRRLGARSLEAFRDQGIMSNEVFEIVSGQQLQNTKAVQSRIDAVNIGRGDLERLEMILPYEGQVLSLSKWNKLGFGTSKPTALNSFRRLEGEGMVILSHGAAKGTSFQLTEKGKNVLQAFREQSS